MKSISQRLLRPGSPSRIVLRRFSFSFNHADIAWRNVWKPKGATVRQVFEELAWSPLKTDHEVVSVQIQRHLIAVDFLYSRAVDIVLLDYDLAVDHRE